MQSPVTARHYISDEVQEKEQARIFRKLWIFAGLKQLLKENNAFITRKIGEVPVVIQNMNGTLKAFENLCPHRQMAMQTEMVGCRQMICKYHGWAFDEVGKIRALANDFLYELTPEEKSRACLRPFALAEIGNMLFVNVDENPMPIEEQFTPEFIASMEDVSNHFDDEVAYTVFQKKHNWKLTFENILDYNHVPFIHPRTFFPYIQLNINAPPPERLIPESTREIKAMLERGDPIHLRDLSYQGGSPLEIEELWYHSEVERYRDEHRYYNWFTYPNVNFCSVWGAMFLIQQYMPVSPGVMEYHLWVLTAKKKNKKANFAALLWGLIKSEKNVIDEDAFALEALQTALYEGARPYTMGVYESHITRALQWYADVIDGNQKKPRQKSAAA